MLERIREGSQGTGAKIILTLVILSFALAGIGSYLGQSSQTPIATVNGKEISQVSFARAYENERARLEQQFGEYFSQIASDPAYMNRIRESVLDRLVQQELQSQLAHELGLRVSDEALKSEIRNAPAFQIAGEFNNDRYMQYVRQLNYQPSEFRDFLREEMTRNQLVAAIAATDFALDGEVKAALKLQSQMRDIQVATISADTFNAEIEVASEEIKDYYDLNQTQFMSPEQVALEYIELKASELTLKEPVTDAEIAAYYEDHKAQYLDEERRRVAHILVEAGDDTDAAKAQAEAILAEIKSGADFAKLAEEKSADAVSAELGGDLDWIERDMMDPAFDEAAFGLSNVGDVSDVVETEFGFHIIKLTDLQQKQVKTLEQMQAEIRATLENDKKLNFFYDVQNKVAELAFEVSDSLAEAAAAAGVEVKSSELFARNNAPAPLNDSKVLSAAFSVELVEDKVNSEAINLGDEHVLFVRVKDHKAAAVKPLDEVQEGIKAQLVAEKAKIKATEQAQTLLAQVKAGADLATAAQALGLTVNTHEGLLRNSFQPSYEVVQAAFKMQSGLANAELVTQGTGDVSIVALNKVYDGPEKPLTEQDKQGFARLTVNNHFSAFVEALREQAEVKAASLATIETQNDL